MGNCPQVSIERICEFFCLNYHKTNKIVLMKHEPIITNVHDLKICSNFVPLSQCKLKELRENSGALLVQSVNFFRTHLFVLTSKKLSWIVLFGFYSTSN